WGRIDFVGHHLAHAYSLVATGLPPNSLILVSDTTAERNSISTYFFTGRDMVHLSSSPFPHSVGSVFHQLAHHLGFRGRTGPGKLMALSAFGEPRYLTELQAICKVEKGVFEIDLGIFPAWMRDGSWPVFARSRSPEFRDVIRLSQRSFEGGKDIAASAQAWFTETTWKIIVQSAELLRTRYGASVKHVGLAGGAALNCQANGDFRDLIEQCGLGSLIVSPWSDDSGTAIGAAIWAFAKRGTPVDCIRHSDAFLGPLATASQQSRNGYFGIRSAASVLAEGRTVALVSGRSEFGPRALGGRCVLADPRREEARRHLNRMKGRPEFMPIAPAVLKSDFGKYFEGIGSPHMAWTVKARTRSHSEIPAAVHRNGTARVQVVDETASPLLANLLREFQLKTGHPVLLLTSLNGAGEAAPIFLDKAREVAEGLGVDGVLTDSEWLPVRVQDTA
ncbi:MAG: carbamoyltransferase C-terminal domain-containing protein, partial [Pyrinomonadaceae bacterium]